MLHWQRSPHCPSWTTCIRPSNNWRSAWARNGFAIRARSFCPTHDGDWAFCVPRSKASCLSRSPRRPARCRRTSTIWIARSPPDTPSRPTATTSWTAIFRTIRPTIRTTADRRIAGGRSTAAGCWMPANRPNCFERSTFRSSRLLWTLM